MTALISQYRKTKNCYTGEIGNYGYGRDNIKMICDYRDYTEPSTERNSQTVNQPIFSLKGSLNPCSLI